MLLSFCKGLKAWDLDCIRNTSIKTIQSLNDILSEAV
jgi:hypothetical protein